MTLTESQQKLATHLLAITDFCLANKGKAMPWASDKSLLFRYVADCFYHGKINIAFHEDKIEAVVFGWPDFREHIEAKAAEDMPQFEWGTPHRGDSMFIADVFGKREAVARLYRGVVDKYPQLMAVPWFTFRRTVLVKISRKQLERFARGAVV